MNKWLDFKSIKSGVSLESVFRHYRVELRRSGKDQYRGRCPIHHGDGREAFHANFARNVFHCFACGAGGNVMDFVAAIERCSVYQAAQKLHTQIISVSDQSRPLPDGKELVTKRRKIALPLPFELRGVDCTHPYLSDRGISNKTACEFGVGFYGGPGLMRGRLVIPIHNAQGELIAYCGRSLDQTSPRYRVPPGFAKSEVLFNMHRAAATEDSAVVVVEGFFDCMKVHQAGIPSVVALMGAVLYEPQCGVLVDRFRQVILMLDGDITGRKAIKVIAEKLRPISTVQVLRLPAGAQPDQLSPETIREMLQTSVMSRDILH